MISTTTITHDSKTSMDYFADALLQYEEKKLVFALYHQVDHWVLLVIMPLQFAVYKLDSLPDSDKELLFITHLRKAYQQYLQRNKNKQRTMKRHLEVRDYLCPR